MTGTLDLDKWKGCDPFSETRVGNETNPFVENADITVQEVCDDKLEFHERLVYIFEMEGQMPCVLQWKLP